MSTAYGIFPRAHIVSRSTMTGTCRAGHTIWLVPFGARAQKWVGAGGDTRCGATNHGHDPVSTITLERDTNE